MLPVIVKNRKIDWKLTTRRYILPPEIKIEQTELLSRLNISDADWIYENSKYKDFLSIEYIKDRITNGESRGIRIDNKLTAWVITQDDGAIGFLTVLSEFRNKGLAKKLMCSIINEIRNKNNLPFVYIEDNNTTAVKLCTKLGFQKDRLIHWIKLV